MSRSAWRIDVECPVIVFRSDGRAWAAGWYTSGSRRSDGVQFEVLFRPLKIIRYLGSTFRIRPPIGSIKYAQPLCPATTLLVPFVVATTRDAWVFHCRQTEQLLTEQLPPQQHRAVRCQRHSQYCRRRLRLRLIRPLAHREQCPIR